MSRAVIIEKKGDLFKLSDPKDALAHCVSEDLNMGAGIAKEFESRFGSVLSLFDQKKKPGQVAILDRQPIIFYLVTKKRYWQKPHIDTLRDSLEEMKNICVQRNNYA